MLSQFLLGCWRSYLTVSLDRLLYLHLLGVVYGDRKAFLQELQDPRIGLYIHDAHHWARRGGVARTRTSVRGLITGDQEAWLLGEVCVSCVDLSRQVFGDMPLLYHCTPGGIQSLRLTLDCTACSAEASVQVQEQCDESLLQAKFSSRSSVKRVCSSCFEGAEGLMRSSLEHALVTTCNIAVGSLLTVATKKDTM